MITYHRNEASRLKVAIVCTVVVAIGLVTSYFLPVGEPARILLLGATLVGVAVWGRRRLARQEHP